MVVPRIQRDFIGLAKAGRWWKRAVTFDVAAHIATRKAHNLETFYNGFGGWGWHRWGGGMGIATTHVETYAVGTLVVDLFDSRTK